MAWPFPWRLTGLRPDLAYIAEGDIITTSRIKEIIIGGSRNLYPSELEEEAGKITDIRKGSIGMFAS
jgi:acyl-CoA synthetase (AMP-forming)/AMP-acid ligase II